MFSVFASLDEVPEALRAKAVKQDDGSYKLEGNGLVEKNSELLGKIKDLQKLADLVKGLDPSNLTPDKIQQALKEHENAAAREQEVSDRIQTAVQKALENKAGEVTAANQKTQKMRTALDKYLIDGELAREISSNQGDARFIIPDIRSRFRVVEKGDEFKVEVLSEDGKSPALDGEGKPVTIKGFIEGIKADKAYGNLFQTQVATGPNANSTSQQGRGQETGPNTNSGFTIGTDGMVTLTRTQGRDLSIYRKALDTVKGDMTRIKYSDTDAPAAA